MNYSGQFDDNTVPVTNTVFDNVHGATSDAASNMKTGKDIKTNATVDQSKVLVRMAVRMAVLRSLQMPRLAAVLVVRAMRHMQPMLMAKLTMTVLRVCVMVLGAG